MWEGCEQRRKGHRRGLASEIPAKELKAMLISKAVSHVEMEGGISWRDKAQLIDFIAKVLKQEWETQ